MFFNLKLRNVLAGVQKMITIHKCTNIPVPNREGIQLISFIKIIILESILIILLFLRAWDIEQNSSRLYFRWSFSKYFYL